MKLYGICRKKNKCVCGLCAQIVPPRPEEKPFTRWEAPVVRDTTKIYCFTCRQHIAGRDKFNRHFDAHLRGTI